METTKLSLSELEYFTLELPFDTLNSPIGNNKTEVPSIWIGKSETKIIFGASQGDQLAVGLIVTNKNFGVIEAAKKGKIDKIATVDVKTTNFYIFQKVEIIVTGE